MTLTTRQWTSAAAGRPMTLSLLWLSVMQCPTWQKPLYTNCNCGQVTYIQTDHITAHNTANGLLLLLWRLRQHVSLNCWWISTRTYHLTRCYSLQKPPSEPYLTDQKESVRENTITYD